MNLFHTKIVVKNPCTETTCQNDGTCYVDSLSNAECFCKEGFGGKFCEIVKRPTAETTTTTTTTTTNTTKASMASYSKLNLILIWNKTSSVWDTLHWTFRVKTCFADCNYYWVNVYFPGFIIRTKKERRKSVNSWQRN